MPNPESVDVSIIEDHLLKLTGIQYGIRGVSISEEPISNGDERFLLKRLTFLFPLIRFFKTVPEYTPRIVLDRSDFEQVVKSGHSYYDGQELSDDEVEFLWNKRVQEVQNREEESRRAHYGQFRPCKLGYYLRYPTEPTEFVLEYRSDDPLERIGHLINDLLFYPGFRIN